MEKHDRKSVFDNLNKYCTFSIHRKDDFIEVTEWSNGEGYDICISNVEGPKHIYLTWGELKAINTLVKELDKK